MLSFQHTHLRPRFALKNLACAFETVVQQHEFAAGSCCCMICRFVDPEKSHGSARYKKKKKKEATLIMAATSPSKNHTMQRRVAQGEVETL
jgi:hypothetical protein